MSEPKYEVAISFLSRDEPIAKDLHDRLSASLSVFFFPRNQEELAGTNGMETMRLPFLDQSRISIVLYRDGWGKTPWTGVEETAITEGCLKGGWKKLFFIMLDESKNLPTWLPEHHVRFNLKDYGIDQAVGAIKLRVQEQGGTFTHDDANNRARIAKQEADYLATKKRLFWDQKWITEYVRPTVMSIFQDISARTTAIAKEHGLPIGASVNNQRCLIQDGYVSVAASWQQTYANNLEDARFIVSDFNGVWAEGGFQFRRPEELHQRRYCAELSHGGELCWIEEQNPDVHFTHERLADQVVKDFLDLFGRRQRGELPSELDRFINDD